MSLVSHIKLTLLGFNHNLSLYYAAYHLISCFKSNPHLPVSAPSDGGSVQLMDVEEWLQVEPESYEPLKQTAELQGDINIASLGMHSICSLRAAAVERLWKSKSLSEKRIYTAIKSFPVGLSTRNLCIVGKFSPK